MTRDLVDKVAEEISAMGDSFETFRYSSSEVVLNSTAFRQVANAVSTWAIDKHSKGASIPEVGLGASKGYFLGGFQLGYTVARKELGLDIIPKGMKEV